MEALHHYPRSTGAQYDTYWQLGVPQNSSHQDELHKHLWQQGYRALATLTRPKLIELIQSQGKSLKQNKYFNQDDIYEECRWFITSRGANFSDNTPYIEAVMQYLYFADRWNHFDRFLDLPPELRSKLYEYYVAEFNKILHEPCQPPLVKTSKLVRTEALPVFYENSRFQLYYAFGERYRPPIKAKPTNETYLFLSTMAAKYMACIRRFNIEFESQSLRSYGRVRFDVTLGKGGDGVRVYMPASIRGKDEGRVNQALVAVGDHVEKIEKLRIEDFDAIRRIVEGALGAL